MSSLARAPKPELVTLDRDSWGTPAWLFNWLNSTYITEKWAR